MRRATALAGAVLMAAPVAFAQCEVTRNKTHHAELGTMLRMLGSH